MDVLRSLQEWLARRSLKDLSDADRASYTEQVMAKVRALEPARQTVPTRPSVGWGWQPQWVLGLSAALVAVAVLVITRQPAERFAPPAPNHARMAENGTDDAAWLEETLQLLEELNEEPGDTAGDGMDEEEWLKELELLDESDLAAS
jgi:hypothetical protein